MEASAAKHSQKAQQTLRWNCRVSRATPHLKEEVNFGSVRLDLQWFWLWFWALSAMLKSVCVVEVPSVQMALKSYEGSRRLGATSSFHHGPSAANHNQKARQTLRWSCRVSRATPHLKEEANFSSVRLDYQWFWLWFRAPSAMLKSVCVVEIPSVQTALNSGAKLRSGRSQKERQGWSLSSEFELDFELIYVRSFFRWSFHTKQSASG